MGCLTCLKVFLVLLDVVYGLTGAAVLALGIVWFFKDRILTAAVGIKESELNALLNGAGANLSYYMQIAAIVFLVIGSVIIVTCILACVAIGTMNSVMFALFLTPLFLIMLLNFAIGALIVIEARPFIGDEPSVKQNILSMLQQDTYLNSDGSYTLLGKAWNVLQISNLTQDTGGCCGVYGPLDYKNSSFQQHNEPNQVPVTCCKLNKAIASDENFKFSATDTIDYTSCNAAVSTCTGNGGTNSCTDNSGNLNTLGCINSSLYNIIHTAVIVGFSIFFAWGGWEFLMFVLGILVCCYGRNEDKYV